MPRVGLSARVLERQRGQFVVPVDSRGLALKPLRIAVRSARTWSDEDRDLAHLPRLHPKPKILPIPQLASDEAACGLPVERDPSRANLVHPVHEPRPVEVLADAGAVADATYFGRSVSPRPNSSTRASSSGVRRTGVSLDSWRYCQNSFPGDADSFDRVAAHRGVRIGLWGQERPRYRDRRGGLGLNTNWMSEVGEELGQRLRRLRAV